MNPIALIAAHCFETLPDSLAKRRALLEALLGLVITGSPLRPLVQEMIDDLDRQDRAQLHLAGMFRQIVNPTAINPGESL